MLLKVGPHGASLLRNSVKIRKTRSSKTVPKILVLLVRARPRCHALPVLSACGLWCDPFAPFHRSRDLFAPFLTFFMEKFALFDYYFLLDCRISNILRHANSKSFHELPSAAAGHQTSGGLPSPCLISMQILVTKFEPIQPKYTSVTLKKTCSCTVWASRKVAF